MARIPDDELKRLKEELDLAALVRAAGVELAPVGQDLRGRCPFHDDQGPSLIITPSKNLWHCLGACGTGGSTIDWTMRVHKVSFRHAVEILRSKEAYHPTIPSRAKTSHSRRLPPAVTLDPDDQKLLNQVAGFYHESLKAAPEALAYIEHRGLKSSEAVERFKLGYSNRSLTYRLPGSQTVAGKEIRSRLGRIGIYRESGHEHLSGSLVIPIFDAGGNVVGMYGRKIQRHLDAVVPRHLYLPGPHKGVWNLEGLQGSKEVILCEALIDALTFWCAGIRNVTTSYGVQGFTDEILEALKVHRVERILIAYDRDDAGDQAAAKLAPRLAAEGFDVSRILFPRDLDANDYARQVPNPAEALGILVRSAEFMLKSRLAAPAPLPIEPLPLAAEAAAKEEELAPEPAAPAAAQLKMEGDQVELALGDRRYRVRGLAKNLSYDTLRVNVRVSRGEAYHVDTFDLLSARQRQVYIKQAADELALKPEILKKDLGKLLFELERLQEQRIEETLKPRDKTVAISEPDKAEALALLQDPDLLGRLLSDFEKAGVIGEETNKLVGYLAAVSRKMDEPLALLIQSNSAAGKSALMDAVLAFMPEEEVERFTALTGQSLYYMADTSFKQKILAIAEVAGAEKAGYAIKMLQSEGKISIATTIKDPESGQLKTKKHEVEGPVAIMLTTTEATIDEELQNRAVVLTVNEDRAQTKAIHEAQRRRETLEGVLAKSDRLRILRIHQNAQRLLKPMLVVNPYARDLTFLDTKLRARRDHMKYLTLIRAIVLLHQYQRPVRHVEHQGKTLPYLEVTPQDVAIANRLAGEVLGRSLDELAPQTRRLLVLLDRMVAERTRSLSIDREDFRFTRREARDWTKWGHTQLAVHLERLVTLEYLAVHRGGRGQGFVYELLYGGEGPEGGRFLVGLIDPRTLYDAKLPASGAHLPAPFRPASGPVPGSFRSGETGPNRPPDAAKAEIPSLAATEHGTGEARESVVVQR